MHRRCRPRSLSSGWPSRQELPRDMHSSAAQRQPALDAWKQLQRAGKANVGRSAWPRPASPSREASITSPGRSIATPGPTSRSSPGSGAGRYWPPSACCRGSSAPARFVSRAPRQGNRDGIRQRADGERLAQQLVADEVTGFAFADISGDEEDREIVMRLLQMLDQLRSRHLRHDHVADDKVEGLAFEEVDRFGAAAASDRIVVEVLQGLDGR